jgi:chromosome segregation ATPase
MASLSMRSNSSVCEKLEKLKLSETEPDDAKTKQLNQLLHYYEYKLSENIKNENEFMRKLCSYSHENVLNKIENNLLLKQLNELREFNLNEKHKLDKENAQFKQKISEYESQLVSMKQEIVKVKESLETKTHDLERMEKDCEEITEKLQKQLDNERQSKKELQTKANEYKIKLLDSEKLRANFETKLKDSEEKLGEKDGELSDKCESLKKAEGDIEKLKEDIEKYKSVFTFVKNVNI